MSVEICFTKKRGSWHGVQQNNLNYINSVGWNVLCLMRVLHFIYFYLVGSELQICFGYYMEDYIVMCSSSSFVELFIYATSYKLYIKAMTKTYSLDLKKNYNSPLNVLNIQQHYLIYIIIYHSVLAS